MQKRYTSGFIIGICILLTNCGTSIYGGYNYSNELGGNVDSLKINASIHLKMDSIIFIGDRYGKYYFDKDSNIITAFDDSQPPFKLMFRKGQITWEIIDSLSVYNKVISKAERMRLENNNSKK